jgi:hypothetical protein
MKIRNWNQFQHFKDRCPPWIKLHRNILDQRDINLISDRSFRVLVGLWLLASEDRRMEGNLPPVEDIAFRLRMDKSVTIKALQELRNFLDQHDINAISTRYQLDDPETETETETEERQRQIPGTSAPASPASELVTLWNTMAAASGLPTCSGVTGKRLTSFRARLKESGWREAFPTAIAKIPACPFLRGENDRAWRANIDWLLKPDSVTRIIEGAYDNNKPTYGETHDDSDYKPF